MKFRCSHCGALHDPTKDSIVVNPKGSLAHYAWYRDPKQSNRAISATLCLLCGTVHGTTPSITKAFFTLGNRPLDVQFYLTIERLILAVSEIGNPLPPGALELLVERGFLNDFIGNTGRPFGNYENDDFFRDALNAASTRFAIYCQQSEQGQINGTTLRSFMLKAEQLAVQDSQNISSHDRTHISSAQFFHEILADGAPVEIIFDAAKP